MTNPFEWLFDASRQSFEPNPNSISTQQTYDKFGKFTYLQDEVSRRGYPNTDMDDNLIMQYLMNLTGNSRERDEANSWATRLVDWIQSLNQRDYDRNLQLDERSYQEGLRDEQRSYDSPSSQLSRLMATGLSRGAALELLGGSAAGSSASALGSSSPIPSSPVVGNQGRGKDTSTEFVEWSSGVQNIVNSLVGLASLAQTPISVSTAIKQDALTNNSLYASNLQRSSRDAVGKFYSALYATDPNTGKYLSAPTAAQSLSLESLMSFANSVPESVNPSLYRFMRSPEARSFMQNPFAPQDLSSMFNFSANTQRDKLEEDILTQSNLLQANKHLGNISVVKNYNDLLRTIDEYEDYKNLRPVFNQVNLMRLQDDLDLLKASRTPEQLAFRIDKLCNDNSAKAYISFCENARQRGLFELYQDNPAMADAASMCAFLDLCGFTGEVGQVAKIGAVSANAFSSLLNTQSEEAEPSFSTPSSSSDIISTEDGLSVNLSNLAKDPHVKNAVKKLVSSILRGHGDLMQGVYWELLVDLNNKRTDLTKEILELK